MATTLPESIQQKIHHLLAAELAARPQQVTAAVALLDEGATVPFIARYRKEVTGGLDEVQLREVHERAEYLVELEDRRAKVLESIAEQGKLDDALKTRIESADTKQALEDLYLPYKPKRRTRATIAKERGLEPLADRIWIGSATDAEAERDAAAFVDAAREVPDVDAALAGRAIYHEDWPLLVNRSGYDERAWFTFSYSPARGDAGEIAGMFCAVQETTGRIEAERRIAAEGRRFAELFEQAPAFMARLRGPEHVVEVANAAYLRLAGHRDLLGRRLADDPVAFVAAAAAGRHAASLL